MEAIQKRVITRFFNEKSETLKKIFFQKVLQMAISYLHGLLFKNGSKKWCIVI
jgi:hypothetical protein